MNIFKKINFNMFKVLSSRDRELNYDILNNLYNLFCKENGDNFLLKDDVMKYLYANINISIYKEIDDENDEDIKSKNKLDILRQKYNQFKNTGWIEEDNNDDLEIIVSLTDKAIEILKTLNHISDNEEENEFIGYVFTIYSNLQTALSDIDSSIPHLEQAYRNCEEFSNELLKMTSTIKGYTTELLNKENYQAKSITAHLFEEYNDKVGIKLFTNLKTKDNPTKYARLIQDYCKRLLDDKDMFPFLLDAYKRTKRKTKIEDYDIKKLKEELYFIYNVFLNINSRINEIDRKNSSYLKIADEKIKFIINESKDVEENINNCLKLIKGIEDSDFENNTFNLSFVNTIDNDSLYKARIKNYKVKEIPLEDHNNVEIDEKIKENLIEKVKYNKQFLFTEINSFILNLLGNKNEIEVKEIDKEIPNLLIKLFLAVLYQNNTNCSYKLINKEDELINLNGYEFNNFIIRRK